MPDEKPASPGSGLDENSNPITDDWGKEWETGPNAEGQPFGVEGKGPDPGSTSYDFIPPSGDDLSQVPDFGEEFGDIAESEDVVIDSAVPVLGRVEAEAKSSGSQIPPPSPPSKSQYWRQLKDRVKGFPWRGKIVWVAGIALLLGGGVLLTIFLPGRQGKDAPSPHIEEGIPRADHQPIPWDKPLGTTVSRELQKESLQLPSFLIPVSEKGSNNINFVLVDLTLFMRQAAPAPMPIEKQRAIREIIYQFYRNVPLFELKKYVLSRDEMKKRLQDWIQKLMPGDQLLKLTFNHYEVRALSNVSPNHREIPLDPFQGAEGTPPEKRGRGNFIPAH